MNITPEDLVRREVHYCVSYLVSTLAGACGDSHIPAISELSEQALELAAPIDDWEEAAIQDGWTFDPENERWTENDKPEREGSAIAYERTEDLCRDNDIEPYAREVYEHWIVSDWLADKLEAEGEKVDRDFAGMTVWARTTTGQAIYADGVMERIAAAFNASAEG